MRPTFHAPSHCSSHSPTCYAPSCLPHNRRRESFRRPSVPIRASSPLIPPAVHPNPPFSFTVAGSSRFGGTKSISTSPSVSFLNPRPFLIIPSSAPSVDEPFPGGVSRTAPGAAFDADRIERPAAVSPAGVNGVPPEARCLMLKKSLASGFGVGVSLAPARPKIDRDAGEAIDSTAALRTEMVVPGVEAAAFVWTCTGGVLGVSFPFDIRLRSDRPASLPFLVFVRLGRDLFTG